MHGDPVTDTNPDASVHTLREELAALKKRTAKLERKDARERELEPYQVELLKLQRHLEANAKRMIVLFEGRDAAGKGGTIRRVTRYMNEKHYRVVALGKPTEDQRTQWYLQRYVAAVPPRRRDGAVRSQLVQPGDGRAGVRVLHRGGVRATSCGVWSASRRTSSARARSW